MSEEFVSALDMPDVPKVLPEHLQSTRTRVFVGKDAPDHTASVTYSGAYRSVHEDNSLNFDDFKRNFKVDVKKLNDEVLEFDMSGIDASIANTFRRILIAEVPTMAIEHVFIANNTSIIQDEVLSHRLGLIPIKADPELFTERNAEEQPSQKDTIVFELDVKCYRENDRIVNETVLSSQLKWLPKGSAFSPDESDTKFTAFTGSQLDVTNQVPITPVNEDIIIAKLRPGQCIHLEAHCVKGIGATHAKWSPVATAFYRLLPEVLLTKPVKGSEAESLKKLCPKDVFDIEDGNLIAARPRDCSMCRECLNAPDHEGTVDIRRIKDHFLFSIESTGQIPPHKLFTKAVRILKEKCSKTKQYIG